MLLGAVSGFTRRSAARAKRSRREGGSNSVVESQPSKLLVAGSIPVSRSRSAGRRAKAPKPKGWSRNEGFVLHLGLRPSALGLVKADVAQLAERVLGKDEVTSSILVIGSIRLGRFAPSLMASR